MVVVHGGMSRDYGHNFYQRKFKGTVKKNFEVIGIGCPERLYNGHPWRHIPNMTEHSTEKNTEHTAVSGVASMGSPRGNHA